MSIRADVEELKGIRDEIVYLTKKRTALKKRQKNLEKKIADYLEQKGQPGVKFQGTAIIVEKKEKTGVKRGKEKDLAAIRELEKNGINNAEEVLKKIKDAMKGEKTIAQSLKFKTIKNQS